MTKLVFKKIDDSASISGQFSRRQIMRGDKLIGYLDWKADRIFDHSRRGKKHYKYYYFGRLVDLVNDQNIGLNSYTDFATARKFAEYHCKDPLFYLEVDGERTLSDGYVMIDHWAHGWGPGGAYGYHFHTKLEEWLKENNISAKIHQSGKRTKEHGLLTVPIFQIGFKTREHATLFKMVWF